MHAIVCYDIPANSRRNKLHKRLGGFLRPVQRSVFEGPLQGNQLTPLLATIKRTIDPRKDDVRIYLFCKSCVASTILMGIAFSVEEEKGPIVV